jgi:hypothetical protein
MEDRMSEDSSLNGLLTAESNSIKIENLKLRDRFVMTAVNMRRATGCSYVEMLEALVISLAENRAALEKQIIDRAMIEPMPRIKVL